MTLDDIIQKYGTHDLDIDGCTKDGEVTTVYAYCHQHNVDGQFMINRYLKIAAKIVILKADLDDATNVNIHAAFLEKASDGAYEIGGVGGWIRFVVNGEVSVKELTEENYNKEIVAFH